MSRILLAAFGQEIFVNPDKVIWVKEYPNHTTVISCGHEDGFAVRLVPACGGGAGEHALDRRL